MGGNLNNGANDGAWYWNLDNDVGNSNWNIGAPEFLYKNTKMPKGILLAESSPLGENIAIAKVC